MKSAAANRKVQVIGFTLLGMLTAFLMIFPVVWLLFSSFKPRAEMFAYPLKLFPSVFDFSSYKSVVDGGFFVYVKNSFFLAVVGTIITLVISSFCGYALAIYRNEIRYTNKVFAIFLLGTLIPGDILTVPQFAVISALGLFAVYLCQV